MWAVLLIVLCGERMNCIEQQVEEGRKKPGRPRTFSKEKVLFQVLDIFWRLGYENASIKHICAELGLTPPSLYAAFGSKEQLFCQVVDAYETKYWDGIKLRLVQSEHFKSGVMEFFREAAQILTLNDTPCGCLVVLATINAKPQDKEVMAKIEGVRTATENMFIQRVQRAQEQGQLRTDADAVALGRYFNLVLDGMSVQAHFGRGPEFLLQSVAFLEPMITSLEP